MLDEIISYHRYMVEIFLFIMSINLILPYLLRQSPDRMIFWSRLGYFSFWTGWSTTIFTGLILFMFTQRELTVSVVIMLIVATILAWLDSYRSIKSRKIWRGGQDAVGFSALVVLGEIVLLIALSLFVYGAH